MIGQFWRKTVKYGLKNRRARDIFKLDDIGENLADMTKKEQGGDMMKEIDALSGYEDVLLPKDVQMILRVGRSTVQKLLSTGTIKSIRVGSTYRIPKKYLIEYMFPEETEKKEAV